MQNVQEADTQKAVLQDIILEENDDASLFDTLIGGINSAGLYIATLSAWIALTGSLFMSEVLMWTPCVLCWYQRILMYPLALILPIGILRRDRGLPLYVLPVSIFGAGVSLYHYLLIKTTWLPAPPCGGDTPCSVDYWNFLGFINTPFLAFIAFLIITIMVIGWTIGRHEDDTPVTLVRRLLSGLVIIVIIAASIGGFILAQNMVLSA